jgi:hypothetical protein
VVADMKPSAICLVALSLVTAACDQKTDKTAVGGPAAAPDAPQGTRKGPLDPAQALAQAAPDGKLITHKLLDDKFLEMASLPLPDNWIVNHGKAFISGPGNVHVYMFPLKTFMYSNDAMMQQLSAQSGNKMRPFVSIEKIIQQDLVPVAQKEGSKLVKQYDAPQIAASDKSFSDLLYKVAPMRQVFHAKVTEWTDKKGAPYMIVVHASATDLGNMVSWNYSCHALDAPKERYEDSKKIVLNALANLRYNAQYVQAYNQNEMAKERASWAAHNQRMQANKEAFEAQQRTFREKNDAINNAIASSYAERDAASDRMHNRFLNYIKDENTVRNPADGQRHQVQTGANQYWMNGNGQYVPSNNPNYDPNRDPSLNQQTWNETQMEE